MFCRKDWDRWQSRRSRMSPHSATLPHTVHPQIYADFAAEVEGERDAAVEENAPATPGPDVVEADAAADATADTAAAAPAEVDPEENQKGLDAYLAERAAAAFEFGKKEGRQVNADSLEGQEFRRQGIEDFFSAKVSQQAFTDA